MTNFSELVLKIVSLKQLEMAAETTVYMLITVWVCVSIVSPFIRWVDIKALKRSQSFVFKSWEKFLFVLLPVIFVGLYLSLSLGVITIPEIVIPTEPVEDHTQKLLPYLPKEFSNALILHTVNNMAFWFFILIFVTVPAMKFLFAASSSWVKKHIESHISFLPPEQTPIPLLRSVLRVVSITLLLSQPISSMVLFDINITDLISGSEHKLVSQNDLISGQTGGQLASYQFVASRDINNDLAPEEDISVIELDPILGLTKEDRFRLAQIYILAFVMFIILNPFQNMAVILLFIMFGVIRPLLFNRKNELQYPNLSTTERHFIFWFVAAIYAFGVTSIV
jgi:hypothetical protein